MSSVGIPRVCPACGSAGPHPSREVPGKQAIGGAPLTLVRCSCGTSFQPHTPTADELARWYDYMGHNPRNVEVSALVARRIARIVDTFRDCRQTGRLLEVGCGGGVLVRAAAAADWQVWGTEISPSCVELLRPLLGDRLFQGSIVDAPFAAGSFDGVAMIEVVEHLDDPGSYLEAVRRLLRPGGRVLLTTPNAHGSAARVLGHRWRAVTDEHLNYFGRQGLCGLLERHGFAPLRVSATNLDLLGLAAEQRHRLRRWRRAITPSAAAATRPADPSPAPAAHANVHADGRGVQARARVADLAIEVLNRFATASRLGDTLRVVAQRTS